MKHTLLILATIMCCSFSTSVQQAPQASAKVYICTGPQSKRYHKTPHCKGLQSCSKQIKEVTVEQARKLGRTPCKWCYD